ncbi:MAG: DUF3445 domain-containing protein [Rubrivivax sp.]|nr:DUF3445 domain-containing protein [Rubrivivax sp.]
MSFDFSAAVQAPFRMQPGLRRLPAGSPQLTALAPGSRHQREKLAVLSAFADMALVGDPGFDPTPALHALARHAAAEWPADWAWDGRRAVASRLGVAVADGKVEPLSRGGFGLGDEAPRCLRGLAPAWRLAGLLSLAFAEDFAIVEADGARIPWLAVALPSFWAPAEKVGRPFTEVHAPVADNAVLLRAADALMALVTGPDRWERFVWTVTPHPRLHAHPAHVDPEGWPADIAETLPAGAWWRTERQTFIPLAQRRQAVFTILVDVQPLARSIGRGAQSATLHDALASMSPAVLAYRSLQGVRDPLLHWLADRR